MTSRTTPIDLDGFRAAMREAGIEEIVESTLAVYALEAPQVFGRLEAAVRDGDARAAGSAAHALKSASANVWALDLVQLHDQIEGAGRQGDAARLNNLLDDLRPHFAAVLEYVGRA
jgi:HPt (histidine-containing phosphotransfer) domain-containing protein